MNEENIHVFGSVLNIVEIQDFTFFIFLYINREDKRNAENCNCPGHK